MELERLILFDRERIKWQWNLAQIREMKSTDNVVELTIANLKKLPAATQ